jgi:hypothetical protein
MGRDQDSIEGVEVLLGVFVTTLSSLEGLTGGAKFSRMAAAECSHRVGGGYESNKTAALEGRKTMLTQSLSGPKTGSQLSADFPSSA